MGEGLLYIIGGITGGLRIKETVLTLSEVFSKPASVLYLGAGHGDDLGHELSFSRSLIASQDEGRIRLSSLRLTQEIEPLEIEEKFEDADVIFFDGGNISALEDVFNKYRLKDLCAKAFHRGASVGGLCAGGSYFGASVIHSEIEDDQLRTDYGLALIPDTTITCYIGDQAQGQRLSLLENEAYKRKETGLGVPINQAITWNSTQGFKRLFPDTMGAVIYKYP